LQHPITLTSQMATSAGDSKATERDIAVWSKFLRPRLRSPRHAAMVFEGLVRARAPEYLQAIRLIG
jgi:hypothetical protein